MKKMSFQVKYSDDPAFTFLILTPHQKFYIGEQQVQNYLTSQEPELRTLYLRTSNKLWKTEDGESKEFWERWLLYNKSTLEKSAKNIERRFHFKVNIPTEEKSTSISLPKDFILNLDRRLSLKII